MSSADVPMRINKYLALKNYGTRRGCDDLIIAKKVYINGRLAVIGDKVYEQDTVEVRKFNARTYAYFAFNKPEGLTTTAESDESKSIIDALPADLKSLKLFPVGRLDKESHGLILLTNDGRVTDRLLSPKFEHEKEYEVKTKMPLRTSFKQKIEAGIDIEGYKTKPCRVSVLGSNRFHIILTEGKTHQVRRMCVAFFNEVVDLKRIRIMNIKLGTLKKGGTRPIEGPELRELLIGLKLS